MSPSRRLQPNEVQSPDSSNVASYSRRRLKPKRRTSSQANRPRDACLRIMKIFRFERSSAQLSDQQVVCGWRLRSLRLVDGSFESSSSNAPLATRRKTQGQLCRDVGEVNSALCVRHFFSTSMKQPDPFRWYVTADGPQIHLSLNWVE